MGLEDRKLQWFTESGWQKGEWKDLMLQKENNTVFNDTIVTWDGFGYHIKFEDIERTYIYPSNGTICFADTEEELKLNKEQIQMPGVEISTSVFIWGKNLPSHGVPLNRLISPEYTFAPNIKDFLETRKHEFVTVLCGVNNSGKSLLLKSIRLFLGKKSSLLACNRFYHIDTLSYSPKSSFQYQQHYDNWERQFYTSKQNDETNPVAFAAMIQGMNDRERKDFFDICDSILDVKVTLDPVDEDNMLTQYRLSSEGRSLAMASTGVRLVLLMMATLFDKQFSHIIIDEPELGLSPPLQEKMASLIYDKKTMNEKFPHIKSIFIATHSHLFLNKVVTDNHSTTREDSHIQIEQCRTESDFHNLRFNLLGNKLESLSFPSAIVIVEGKTDFAYLDILIRKSLPDNKITVINANGDVKRKVKGLQEVFEPLDKSPMRQRIFVVCDEIHQKGLEVDLIKMGIYKENIVFWSKNGIEYFYPKNVMMKIFMCSESQLGEMVIDSDLITVNGISKTKNTLSEEVVKDLHGKLDLPEEINERFLIPLQEKIS